MLNENVANSIHRKLLYFEGTFFTVIIKNFSILTMFVNNIVLFLNFGGNFMKNPLDSILGTLVAGVILTIVFVYLLKTFF